MRRCMLPCLLAAVLAVLHGACSEPNPNGRRTLAETFCVSSHMPPGDTAKALALRRQEIEDLKDIGMRWIRMDFVWRDLEHARGAFDFSAMDAAVSDALASGFRILGLLGGTPLWATERGAAENDIAYAPDDPDDYARFAGAAAGHYRGAVSDWEIWNEPNLWERFFKPQADPILYSRMFEGAYREIKKANPSATVSFGGIAPSDLFTYVPKLKQWGFLEDALDKAPSIAGHFDALSIHPYTFLQTAPPEEPASAYGTFEEMIAMARDILSAHGAGGRPIWITEFGWPTFTEQTGPYGYGVTPLDQARYLVRTLLIAHAAGVDRSCWYTYRDEDGSGRPAGENYFGFVEYDPDPTDGTPPTHKPAFVAWRELSRQLGGARFIRQLLEPDGIRPPIRAYELTSPGGRRFVLWSETGAESASTLSVNPRASIETVLLATGEATSSSRPRDDTLLVSVGPTPLAVIEK